MGLSDDPKQIRVLGLKAQHVLKAAGLSVVLCLAALVGAQLARADQQNAPSAISAGAQGATSRRHTAWPSSWPTTPLITEKVVILSRHGIRTPYAPSDDFALGEFSTDLRDWPDVDPPDNRWGAIGNVTAALTAHGAQVLSAHGAYLREETWLGMLGGASGPDACDQVTVYADPDQGTHRDRETARFFLSGLLPDCVVNDADSGGMIKVGRGLRPVFNTGADSHFGGGELPEGCPGQPGQQVVDAGITGGSIVKFTESHAELINSMNDAIGCCSAKMCERCAVTPRPSAGLARSGATRACRSRDCSVAVTVPRDGAFQSGSSISVRFSGATDDQDWIGIYHVGHTPGEDGSHNWSYHGSASDSGTVEVTAATPGDYFIVLMCCDGYVELTDRLAVSIIAGPSHASASGACTHPIADLCGLEIPAGPYLAGAPIEVTFSGATDPQDWVGMYKNGHIPGSESSHSWSYHGSASGSGTVTVTPGVAGDYFIVLMCCDGYTEMSTRIALTVEAPCTLMEIGQQSFRPDHYWSLYNGTLAVAASIAEYLQLLYLNGMDTQAVAPGVGRQEIARLMQLHQLNMGLSSGTPWLAQSYGSDLLMHLLATMEQITGGGSSISGLQSRPTDRLVYYAGHDINIYFVRVLLGLNWLTESFNVNQSPPGGMLRFELARQGGAGEWFVRAYFESMSMEQQRDVDFALRQGKNQPDRAFVAIPSCAEGPESSCPLEHLKEIVLGVVSPSCVETVKAWSDAQFAGR